MGNINVLAIHGVGGQSAGFSDGLRDELRDRLGARGKNMHWQEVLWAEELQDQEDQLLEATMKTGQVDHRRLRRFILTTAADALSYRNPGRKGKKIYDAIHDIVGEAVRSFPPDFSTAPVVVLAHSLGAQIMSDYIWDRQHETSPHSSRPRIDQLVGMITFGCNIPLFAMAASPPCPIEVPDPKAPKSLPSAWDNYFDPDDVLGWPLRPLFEPHLSALSDEQKETVARIRDIPIQTGWLLSAHGGYWTDNSFTKPVAKYLQKLIQAAP